jgi:hypothetical protein
MCAPGCVGGAIPLVGLDGQSGRQQWRPSLT